jgi:hypothetical protein
MATTKETIGEHKVLTTMILPPYEPASEEELQRRRALFERTMAIRESIGPIGIDPAQLIRELRDEIDED